LENLKPQLVWRHFDAMLQIPRPSKHEEQISQHVISWAESKGFQVKRDAAGNLVVRVPATPGKENAPTVVLQGHLDMVAEKNQDVDFDFLKDAIKPRIEGDHLYATGTTLGADNGIGLAGGMAVAEDPDAVHGPLELLMTVDEETGLTGAMQLDPSLLEGRLMINLDTEEDGAIYIGCAGGSTTRIRFEVFREDAAAGSKPIHIAVRGLRGGHSGMEIHENRGNALKCIARTLNALRKAGVDFAVVSMTGGSKHNAIPREADAVLRVAAAHEAKLKEAVTKIEAVLRDEFGEIDPNLKLEVKAAEGDTSKVWTNADRDRILDSLLACPNGVMSMSRAVAGLVETSNNLAVMEMDGNKVEILGSSRSSVMPSLQGAVEQVAAVFRLAGAEVEEMDGYPSWKPNPNSPLLGVAKKVHKELFNKEPHLRAIHAGLECGLIGEKFPGMDMISIGPSIEGPHSPDERVQISTVENFYTLLKGVLKTLAA